MKNPIKPTIHTIGYGGQGKDDFLSLLQGAGIDLVADIRSNSRRANMGLFVKAKSPDKGIERLLSSAGIGYAWLEELGNPDPKDPEMRVYQQQIVPTMDERTRRLRELAGTHRVCLLCSCKRPDACHRHVVSGWLADQGHPVVDLV